MMWHRLAGIGLLSALSLIVARPAGAQAQPSPDLATAIDRLGSFDFETRTTAARLVRRAEPVSIVPMLERAVRSHADEYVRFRALVILTGFDAQRVGVVMRAVMEDRNDRLRTVVYQWFERNPDPVILPVLIAALSRERSEFVRPALTRAIAAHGGDARAREVLLPLVMRGEDTFRGALIEALGDHGARYAVSQIDEVARLDGPLQDDAVTALGRIGEPSVRATLAFLQRSAPSEVQPTVSAALCLLDIDCERQEAFIRETLAFALADANAQPILRGVAHALGVLAARGRQSALGALLDAGVGSVEPARAPIALSVGLVALRNPRQLCEVLEARPDPQRVGELVRDAFDMLSEDFEEERFYTAIRQVYWEAPAESARRRAVDLLIEVLEF